jgi:hypothetical protein
VLKHVNRDCHAVTILGFDGGGKEVKKIEFNFSRGGSRGILAAAPASTDGARVLLLVRSASQSGRKNEQSACAARRISAFSYAHLGENR